MRTRFSPDDVVESPYVYVYEAPVDVYSDPVLSSVDIICPEAADVAVPGGIGPCGVNGPWPCSNVIFLLNSFNRYQRLYLYFYV